ncbi:MAG: FliM/FliN family flagellar motor C-terminal domain-containing protein [Heliobacteriaceae bacterium]|jgi:flagellar motor switch protein FliN/FliY|nr:FliM/FliN family flagellar motor C-terminal domain-containing protein [Heliobacteriaceae bacterium]
MAANVNTIDSKYLYSRYDWFKKTFPPVIQRSCDEFFTEGFEFNLIGISKNVNSLQDKDAYFVTKIRLDKQHDMFFRSSEKAVGIILDRVLGKANKKFNLNKMTDLEAKVVTAFSDYMYNAVAPLLSKSQPALKRTNFDVIHLTFLVKDIEEKKVSKFIVSLPEVLLNPDLITSQGEKFNNTDFAKSTIEASVKIGTTKFSFFDLKNIDIDDIVVFDNSDVSKMILKFRDYEKEIRLNPNLGLVLPVDNDGGNNMAPENNSLWDSIEVEMSAQFDTVRITLGDLKAIEEGLVVDLTSIYDNRVTLSVENKPIAAGELVIVNDRYGVKVSEVIAQKPQAAGADSGEYSEEPAQDGEEFAAPQQEATAGEEEFDYSDFELDEDI